MEWLFILFVVAAVAAVIIAYLNEQERRRKLEEYARERGFSLCWDKQYGWENHFPELDCLRQGENRYAFETLQGQWSGRPFLGFAYHYETSYRDKNGRKHTTHHHLSFVRIECETPLRPLLLRPEGFGDKLLAFFGADDIDFESAEFSRKYYVKAPERKWAYDIIDARMMEYLLEQPGAHVQFSGNGVFAWYNGKFSPSQYDRAARFVEGILDRIPDWVLRQQAERHGIPAESLPRWRGGVDKTRRETD